MDLRANGASQNTPLNLVLFEPSEIALPLARSDSRATHILEVLRRSVGDSFDVGLVNGPHGKATLSAIHHDTLALSFVWGTLPPLPPPITLLIGLPRPQTARKILQEATTLGVQALHFVTTARGEPSYASSTLWSSGEWRRHLLAGAAQAFCTRLPDVTFGHSLSDIIAGLPPQATRVALDNYESLVALEAAIKPVAKANESSTTGQAVILALGSERGWTAAERDLLRANHFALAHLGPRVLRTETACVASIAIVKSSLGWL
ncbi:MAG: RNA methyltransferase [Verrucomicrobia bacterium]|nr:RNA methyltransferase [Verrucomicrobiota bacterium]